MPEKKQFERLPSSIIPINYDIRLRTFLDRFIFEGEEKIEIKVNEAVDRIVMNANDLKVSSAKFLSNSGSFPASDIVISDEHETLTLVFDRPLPVGDAHLHLSFVGNLNDKMKGFYRSRYVMPSGEERYAAVTQFEATDARRAFPCWDEPAVKATYDVTLVVPKDRVALSNMPVKSEVPLSDDADWKVVEYEKSPVMSTYLVAFVVGEYDYVEERDEDGVLHRVYTPLGKKEQGRYALKVSVKTLPFYKRYFKIAYPLIKIDLIAIADFAMGAMENWGLVTYRETALLVDPEGSSATSKQYVAMVVGHELAHQWFGNLVTMEWWTHLWLNEGFASWIEYLCVDECFPEYDIWTQFMVMDYARALELDALQSSHPIEVPVGHPTEVEEIFDTISYCKGASVIRMLHDYIGDEAFRGGLHAYLTTFSYKNTFTEDLWCHLEKASGKPVTAVMSGWTGRMGFPCIKVTSHQEGDCRVLTLEQSKFSADGVKSVEDPIWKVPISILRRDGKVERFLLEECKATHRLEGVAASDWLKLNAGTVGFYRVQYSTEMLNQLMEGIRCGEMCARDRFNVENDVFALAKAGIGSTVDALRVMMAFANEEDYTVWNDVAVNWSEVTSLLMETHYYEHVKRFGTKLFEPLLPRVGWDAQPDESHLKSLLRSLVVRMLGRHGHAEVVEESKRRFEKHLKKDLISADLRAPVYSTVLSEGDEKTLEAMLELHKVADLQEEKTRIERALGAVKDETLIRRVLEFSLQGTVRPQDIVFMIGGVSGTLPGRRLTWEFVKEKWDHLVTVYESGSLLCRLIKLTTEGFVTEEKAREVEKFFAAHPLPSTERSIQQSCEHIRLRAAWLAREGDELNKFFTEHA